MPNLHITALLEADSEYFQALCTCGWFSSVVFKEEADLWRAIHAHDVVAFRGAHDVSGRS